MKTKSTLPSFIALTASTLLAVSYSYAANLTWDPANTGNGAAIDPGDGTWNITAENIVWNDAGTNVPWTSANEAVFGGADGTYTVAVGTVAFNAQKILFANSGYTLSSATIARTITLTSPGGTGTQPGLAIASGTSATIGSNVTVRGNATTYIGADNGTPAGTLNIEGTGAVVRSQNTGNSVVIDGLGTIVNVKTGGVLSNAGSTGTGSLAVGQFLLSEATLNVEGGSVKVATTGSLQIGNSGQGTVTLTSGDITVGNTSSKGVIFGLNAANDNNNFLNLNGGLLTTPIVGKGIGTGDATFNFNGGTLQANASKTNFMEGLTTANVHAGGAIIDTQAFSITIAQALLNSGGGLAKNGSGDLILAGANTYNGASMVNAGKLKLATAGTSASTLTVSSGAYGGAYVAATDAQHVSTGNLTLNNDSTLVIDYGTTAPSTTVAPLEVVDFNLGTGIGLLIEGSTPVVEGPVYPLVKWTGTGPVDVSAFTAVISNNLVGTFSIASDTLSVTFSTIGPAISWNTGDGTWNTGTPNWFDGVGSTNYTNTIDPVLFGDAPSAGVDPVVTLNSVFSPLGVTMNSTTRDYTISGSGGIIGPTGLTLDALNTGTLTLATANTYKGPTAINGGTLRLGDGGATGSIGLASAITVASGATFAVNQSDTVTQGTDFAVISGDGGFAQTGGGTTQFGLPNTFTGPTSVTNGTLQIVPGGRLNGGAYAGDIAISSGATFDYSGTASQTLSGIISGQGSLVKAGSSTLTLSGSNTYFGATTINAGVLSLNNLNALQNTSGITLGGASAATLSSSLTGITISAPITTANTGFDSTIAFATSVSSAQGTLTLNGPIGGAGNVIFSSPNVGASVGQTQFLNLGATGTWAGSTTLTAGNGQVAPRLVNTSGTANVLPVGTVLSLFGGQGQGTGRLLTFDLNGQNQQLAGLQNTLAVDRDQRVTSTAPATLTINNTADYAFGGTIGSGDDDGSGKIIGAISLTKTGMAKFTLLASHEYTGNTTVSQGILSQSAPNTFNDASTVTIAASGAFLDLNFDESGGAVTDTVDKLFIGGVQQNAGVYKATDNVTDSGTPIAQITGPGTLTVTSNPVVGGYAAWADDNAGGEDPDLDFDNDGVSNGVEFFINAPAGFTANPQLNASNTISWTNGGNIPASEYGTQFVVQTSSNLSTWTNVLAGDLTTNTDGPGGSLTYILTGGSPRFVRLSVTPN